MFSLGNWLPSIGDSLVHIANYLPFTQPRPMDPNGPRAVYRCGPSYPFDSSVRTFFSDEHAAIFAWPSRGGVIVLDPAEAIDFEFLGLDPLDPPLRRLADRAAEDAFCQQLLRLGAKWWDSEARYAIVAAMEAGETDRAADAFDVARQPPPSMREKRLVRAGWPSTGGVWIAEFETTWAGVDVEEDLLDEGEDMGRLRMARTMDERCAILRDRLRGKFYEDLKDYEGYGFFNSWESKTAGEVGPLLQPHETSDLWVEAHYSRGPTVEEL